MDISVRMPASADAEAFYHLRLQGMELYPDAFDESADDWRTCSLDEVRALLERQSAADGEFFLGAFDGDRLVGVVALRRQFGVKFRHKGAIWGMFVAPTDQQRGVAGQLLDALMVEARKVDGLRRLTVCYIEGNTAAERLFASRGFIEYGREPEALQIGTRTCAEVFMTIAL